MLVNESLNYNNLLVRIVSPVADVKKQCYKTIVIYWFY